MQVYNTFFKILYKQKVQIIMYISIFALISLLASSQMESNSEQNFQESVYKVAIFDYDNTSASDTLTDYISSKHTLVSLSEDTNETLQDEIYNRNAQCVIRIPEGFEESLTNQDTAKKLEIVAIPGTVYANTVEAQLNAYLKNVNSYLSAGFTLDEAMTSTESLMKEELSVSLLDASSDGSFSSMYYFFSYIPYVFMAISIVAFGPILVVFNQRVVRDRIRCSSYRLTKTNIELLLGMVTSGIALCSIFSLLAFGSFHNELFTLKGALYILNMFCFTTITLSITFLIAQFVKANTALSMVANVIGLGFAFLGGVFVPLDLMGENVLQISRFLPTYWYILGTQIIDGVTKTSDLTVLFQYILIELAFTTSFIAIGVVATRFRKGE